MNKIILLVIVVFCLIYLISDVSWYIWNRLFGESHRIKQKYKGILKENESKHFFELEKPIMSYHISNLGMYGKNIGRDIDGYVPTEETGPWDLIYDHGSERTHDNAGYITEYGEWWENERFPEVKAAAIAATAEAEAELSAWQERN